MVKPKKWYKCPRCIRYTATALHEGYRCDECTKVYTKEGFLKKSIKEFGSVQFEFENNG